VVRDIGRGGRRVLFVTPSRTQADQLLDTLRHTADLFHSPVRYAICEVDEFLSRHEASSLAVVEDDTARLASATMPETMDR
jgi:hypothetical protein